jgi:tRNA-(ms[2]io[6]A)-hydroxylase
LAAALADLDATLVDHAHCELKAASNALSMVARHADDRLVVDALSDLAREEIEHFRQVHARLVQRQIPLGAPNVDPYVAALRRAHTTLAPSQVPENAVTVDRLLACALIEARSCERFGLLARALVDRDGDLACFYENLRASEARHYRTFVDLAIHVAGGAAAAVQARRAEMSAAESRIVASAVEARATIHG